MLLDAATTAQRTLAKQDKGDGALRAIFERFDPKHRGTVNARDFDDALRKLGVLRHHRRACLARLPYRGAHLSGLHVLHRVALRRGGDARAEVSRRR